MIKHELNNDKKELLVTIEVSSNEIQELLDKKINEAAKKVKVPGYRPGKAPKDKALARIDYTKINHELIDDLFRQKHPLFVKHIEENKLNGVKLIHDFETKENGDGVLKFILLQAPSFEDVKLDKVQAKIGDFQFTKADFDKKYEEFLTSLSLPVDLTQEQKLENGDTVNIDFKGFIDDKPFEGGEAEGYDLVLGSNSFIAGFEDQLVGKTIGWEGPINVTFPENYFSKEYQGKDAVFEIKINSAKRNETSEINDDKVKLFQIPGVETVEQLKEMFENRWKVEKLVETSNKFFDDVFAEVSVEAKKQVHETFALEASEQLKNNFNAQLKQYKIKKSEYLSLIKTTEEDLEKQFLEEARGNVALDFVRNWVYSQVLAKQEEVQAFVADLKEKQQVEGLFALLLSTKNLLEQTKSDKVAEYSKAIDDLKAEFKKEEK